MATLELPSVSGEESITYGFIGVGAIASSIVGAMCDLGSQKPRIMLSPRNADVSARLARLDSRVKIGPDNQSVVDSSDVLVVSLRARDAQVVLEQLQFRESAVVLSLVAGLDLVRLRRCVLPAQRVVRVIALPSASRSGLVILYPSDDLALKFARLIGVPYVAGGEKAFDAFSVGSAVVASHLDVLSTLSAWLTGQGIPSKVARAYVSSIFIDIARALDCAPGTNFDEIARIHATPGGLNEQLLNVLRSHDLDGLLRSSLESLLQGLSAG